jgi:tRNA dimethylallyltransferase
VYDYKLSKLSQQNDLREYLNKLDLDELQQKLGNRLKVLNESDQKNPRRLIRLIEKESEQLSMRGKELPNTYIVLCPSMKTLERNIVRRTNFMFKGGLEKEINNLLKLGYTFDMPGLNSIGYVEYKPYFLRELSIKEVKANIILHTRQYAKRQITWFKRNKDAIWVSGLKKGYTKILDLFNC